MLLQLKHFFAMGGFAFYIWISYAMVLIILSFILVSTIKFNKRVIKECSQFLKEHKRAS